jgi:hypothetical protein
MTTLDAMVSLAVLDAMVSLAVLDSLALRSSTGRCIVLYITVRSSLGTRRSDRNMPIECPRRADVGRARVPARCNATEAC